MDAHVGRLGRRPWFLSPVWPLGCTRPRTARLSATLMVMNPWLVGSLGCTRPRTAGLGATLERGASRAP